MAERQEGIPVAPAKYEHAKGLHISAVDVVIDAGQRSHFLGRVTAEQRVFNDEDVFCAPRSSTPQRPFWIMAVFSSSMNLRQ